MISRSTTAVVALLSCHLSEILSGVRLAATGDVNIYVCDARKHIRLRAVAIHMLVFVRFI